MEELAQVTVVLVDSQDLVRKALIQMLSAAGLDVVGEAPTGEKGVSVVVDLRPDV